MCATHARISRRASEIFGTNFAAGKKATASNIRGKDSKFGADKALDADAKTYWATDDGVTNASLEVDLGGEKEFNVIRTEEMISLGQRVEKYKVEALVVESGSKFLPAQRLVTASSIAFRK